MRPRTGFLLAMGSVLLVGAATLPRQQAVNLSPAAWPKGEYQRFIEAQGIDRTEAGVATGQHGAVTVAYNGLAARAGLEALKQGGNAMDAALTAALTQVALTAGAPISYFGIMSLVYYDAKTGKVHTMNAEWNTVLGETEPMTIPGSLNMGSEAGLRGTATSGRTALVGGFMKGVGAAHARFGKLPLKHLFEPAVHVAEQGMPVTVRLAEKFRFRGEDLKRLPETRAIFAKPDGSFPAVGEVFRQPALARTLRAVAAQGTDFMYKGPWAERLVAAVQAEGGKMTLEDLAGYDVIWDEPLIADIGGYQVYTNRPPNLGGVGDDRGAEPGGRGRSGGRRPLEHLGQGTAKGGRHRADGISHLPARTGAEAGLPGTRFLSRPHAPPPSMRRRCGPGWRPVPSRSDGSCRSQSTPTTWWRSIRRGTSRP